MRSKKENTEEKQDQIKTHLHNENTINRDEEEMVKKAAVLFYSIKAVAQRVKCAKSIFCTA